MQDSTALTERLAVLERRIRRLTVFSVLAGIGLVVAAAAPASDIIRAKGIILVDAAGRERVLIGAPLSAVSSDAKLGTAAGMVMLDSAGHLQVALGAENPLVFSNGRTGRRMGKPVGMTIYDPRDGGERGGFVVFDDGRANLCLDWAAAAKEAACMSVAAQDQYAAMMLHGTPSQPQFDRVGLFAGADGSGVVKAFGGGANNGGVMIRAGDGAPEIIHVDSAGNIIGPRRPQ